MSTPKPERTKVFISYSHRNKVWLDRLLTMLQPLIRQETISVWADTQIQAGEKWREEIETALAETKVAVLLVSPDFLASDFIAKHELPPLLDAAKNEGVKILWIAVSASFYEATEIVHYQAANDPSRPLDRLSPAERNQALLEIGKQIQEAAKPSSASTDPDDKPLGELPYVQHERNEFFTGREQILQDVRSALVKNGITALYGLGGIGKTQTAIEYAYEYAGEYDNVFWTGAETGLELSAGYREIAQHLNLPVKDLQNLDDIARAVKRHLETTGGWLLILDNADSQEVVRPLLPRKGKESGHVLLTSRSHTFDALSITNPVEVTEMAASEAWDFLRLRTDRDLENPTEAEAAARLAEELDYLPLALEQAGAYINTNHVRFQDYLASYRRRHLQLLEQARPVTGDYKASVRTNWTLNFEQVKAASPASADLLRLSAFLGPDDIPLELFQKGASAMGPTLAAVLAGVEQDVLVLDDVLRPLLRYSLVRRDSTTGGYSIHRLVQAVLRDDMTGDEQRRWAERAVLALDRAFPEPEFADWPLYDRLMPHVQACAAFIERLGIQTAEAGRLLDHAGWFLMERARYSEVEPLLQLSRSIRENILGDNHPDVAKTLNNIAVLRTFQGHPVESEALHLRALQIREQTLKDDDPYLATSLEQLGGIYSEQYRYSDAESLHKRALDIRKKAFGAEHPDVATSFNSLGGVYQGQNRYSEAEVLHKNALDIQEKAFGTEHPDVAISLYNLGKVYQGQRRYSEAEDYIKRALYIEEKTLGTEHPNVAISLSGLGGVYQEQKRYSEAEVLIKRALDIQEKTLGAEHPNVAISLNRLGGVYQEQKRYPEAEVLIKRALDIQEKTLEAEHPDVATSLHNLATLHLARLRYSQAETLFRRARKIYERSLGPEHPDLANTLMGLAQALRKSARGNRAKTDEAGRLEARAQAIQARHRHQNRSA